MKEIGGYFGLEQLVSNEFYANLIALNTCRNALLYILTARKIAKLYIPYYLCDSISKMCDRYGYPYEYYPVDSHFLPVFEKEADRNEYVLIVNYFGQITPEKVSSLKTKYKNIILDNTQAFFQKPIYGVDTIYSCRKFFGVPDGAYLFTDTPLNETLEVDVSKDRMKHLLGRYEGCASDYYSDFKQNDAALADEPIKLMSRLTRNILGAVDYQKVIDRRNENFKYLNEKLKNKNPFELIIPDGPFAYPFYSENAVEIMQKLAEKKIYIPTLWPNVMDDEGASKLEKRYSRNILPIPCDQRYDFSGSNSKEAEIILNHMR